MAPHSGVGIVVLCLNKSVLCLIHETFVAFDVTNFVDVKSYNDILGGGNSKIFGIFIPIYLGKMIQFDEHIFQMG